MKLWMLWSAVSRIERASTVAKRQQIDVSNSTSLASLSASALEPKLKDSIGELIKALLHGQLNNACKFFGEVMGIQALLHRKDYTIFGRAYTMMHEIEPLVVELNELLDEVAVPQLSKVEEHPTYEMYRQIRYVNGTIKWKQYDRMLTKVLHQHEAWLSYKKIFADPRLRDLDNEQRAKRAAKAAKRALEEFASSDHDAALRFYGIAYAICSSAVYERYEDLQYQAATLRMLRSHMADTTVILYKWIKRSKQ